MSTKITVAYGDGIGPEIMESVLSVLQEAGAKISIDVVNIGYKAYEQGWKTGVTDSAWNTIIRNKVFLKAPIATPQGGGFTSLNVTLRKALGLYANVRPCVTYFDTAVDIVVIRENEEDIYSGIEYRHTKNTYNGIKIVSYDASLRICKYAFEYAKINKRKKVTCFVKDNIMKMTDGTFHRAFKKVAEGYPDIVAESYILDIGAALIATKPEKFDVIVTTNLYGDVISDIAAEVTGSLGLAGSANIGPEYTMFEAVHGSAPDIAGKNLANPSGLLNSAISMLSFIGQNEAASKVYNAWYRTIRNGIHTADIYDENSKKKVSTNEFTKEIIANLDATEVDKQPINHYPPIKINYYDDSKMRRKLIGIDLFIEWDSDKIDEIVTRLLSITNEDLKLRNVLAKGLIIWPRNEVLRSLPTDTVCCRFITENNEKNLNDSINLLFSELTDLEITSLQKLYLFDGEEGFRPI
ncbi:MAG: isocitrate dehydrogenase [Rickettsiaceae bacterium H1]|nr:isocitrate dehydrogenase [Rickettsiaceae bacterium H1]